MRIGQTSITVAGSKFIGSFIGFVATVYFARVLGEGVLGQYALALSVLTWAALVVEAGFSRALIKRISEDINSDQFITAGFVLVGVIGFFVGTTLYLLSDYINRYIGAPVTFLIIALLAVNLLNSVINSALQGRRLVHVSAIFSLFGRTARGIFQVGLVFLGFGLAGLLGGYVVAVTATSVIALWYLRPRFIAPSLTHFKSLFHFAKYAWLGNVRSKIVNYVDIAILGFFVSSGLIGIYSIVWSIVMFLDIFGNAIIGAIFPEMSKLSEQRDMNMVATLTEDALTYAGFLLIPGLVGGLIIGDRLLEVYGQGFVRGIEIFGILTAGVLIYAYTKQLLNSLNAVDRPDLAFRVNAIFGASNVVLNVILIVALGWIGAAIATALSTMIGLGISLRYARRIIPFRPPIGEVSRQWTAALSMGVGVYALRIIGENHWISEINAVFVVILVGAGAIIYIMALSTISSQFRSTIRQNLPQSHFSGRLS